MESIIAPLGEFLRRVWTASVKNDEAEYRRLIEGYSVCDAGAVLKEEWTVERELRVES